MGILTATAGLTSHCSKRVTRSGAFLQKYLRFLPAAVEALIASSIRHLAENFQSTGDRSLATSMVTVELMRSSSTKTLSPGTLVTATAHLRNRHLRSRTTMEQWLSGIQTMVT